jgi:hypothetical protein
MDFVKALVPGSLLTFVISMILGSNHSKGAWLNIFRVAIEGHTFYWSWPLFALATGLAWILLAITPK